MARGKTPTSKSAAMNASDEDRPAPWSRVRQDVGAVVWSSFLAACLATMLFFAAFDPLLLASDDNPPWWLESRMTGYGIGFFFFWFVCAVAGFLTSALLHSGAASGTERQGD
jgi:hypothetical protein